MAFHKDFDYVISGNIVDFRKGEHATVASLPRNQGIDLPFWGSVGKVLISVIALDIHEPTRDVGAPHPSDHDPQEGPVTSVRHYNHVPMQVQLFAPGQTQPAATWQTQGGWSEEESFAFQHTIDSTRTQHGSWKCRVTNKGQASATTNVALNHFFDRQALHAASLPRSLIQHAYRLILEALTPSAYIQGRYIHYSFGRELVEYFGDSPPAVLTPVPEELPWGLEGTGEMQTFELHARSGRDLLEAMRTEWQARKDEYERALAQAQGMGSSGQVIVMQQKLEENDAWRRDWEERVRDDFPTIHAHVACSNIYLQREFDLIIWEPDVPIASIEEAFVDVYLAFDPALTRGFALVLSPAEITGGAAEIFDYLGFLPEINDVLDDKLTPRLEAAAPYIGRYLGEAMGRLSARDVVFLRLTADQDIWRTQYTGVPSERVLPGPADPGGVVIVGGELSDDSGGIGDWPERPTFGEMPPEFIVVAPGPGPSPRATYTALLDRVDHLVVVMMENRSFDHMLGYLGLPSDSRYEGVRGQYSNVVTGLVSPVRLRPARDIVPAPVTRIPYSPHHGFSHVEYQVADGAMSGFAQDFENRHSGFAQYVMTYYSGAELPIYDQLAREHAVCDHWFCAFPGGTWPNRWITLSGTTPELHNLEVDDSRIGFLEGKTIFDLLTRRGIKWRVFESDLSVIRTYNRHRLDTTHIVPFYNKDDDSQSFEKVAARGELPEVTFVEPNFRDIPPLSTANDDLAPANLYHGQRFIRRVVDALKASAEKWPRTLLVVTYDEHGGFYDHVPPPGTPSPPGPAEWVGRVPAVHPEGPGRMGVRVPTLLISPLVQRGGVCKQVFDHSSIIKTILLRHRRRLVTDDFVAFGPRVNMAADLGLALSEPGPATEGRAPLPRVVAPPGSHARRVQPGARSLRPEERDDFQESLRRGFLPRRG